MKKHLFVTAFFMPFFTYTMEKNSVTEAKKIIALENQNWNMGKCGICNQKKIEVIWYGQNTDGAHKLCFDLIKPCIKDALAKIDQRHKESSKRVKLQGRINSIIEEVCLKAGYDSIKHFYEVNGTSELKQLYDKATKACLNASDI